MYDIKVAGFEKESFVDGEGIRFVVFTQGCPHHCPGCHNPETHSFNGGTPYDLQDILKMIDSDPILTGLTLSGGEPFCQFSACRVLAKEAHNRNLDVWCYTGYTYETLVSNKNFRMLLSEVDVLVDGRFEINKKDLSLTFRGSSNQRIIDVKKSLSAGKVVLYKL